MPGCRNWAWSLKSPNAEPIVTDFSPKSNQRQGLKARREKGLGPTLLLSLVVHLAVAVVFSGVIAPRFPKERKPVYYVDLVHLPVKNPQAGRPDARPKTPEKPKKTLPEPAPVKKVEPKKAEPKVVKKPEPAKPKAETVKKPAPKPEPKPATKAAVKKAEPKPEPKPEPKAKQGSYDDALAAMKKMQAKKEIEDLKAKLAALAASDTRQDSPIVDAPVGMPEGRGTEAGPSQAAWIQTFLKNNWSLSKYQVLRPSLEAEVHLIYDAQGNLLDFRFLSESGDATFDESVKKAIVKSKTLPFQPDHRLEIDAVFNLKDLME